MRQSAEHRAGTRWPPAASQACCCVHSFLFIIRGHRCEYYRWRGASGEVDKVEDKSGEVLCFLSVRGYGFYLPSPLPLGYPGHFSVLKSTLLCSPRLEDVT